MKTKEELRRRFFLKEEQWQELTMEYYYRESVYIDFYYDDSIFSLSRQNLWLRKRFDQKSNFVYQLIKLDNSGNLDSYEKYDDLEKIKEMCNIINFDEIDSKLKTFCELNVHKETICIPHITEGLGHIGFKVTKNFVTSPNDSSWSYTVYDLKYIKGVEGLSLPEKTRVIDLMCKESKWDNTYMYGRVIEYLRNFSPDHFTKLVNNFVCPPFPENIAVI